MRKKSETKQVDYLALRENRTDEDLGFLEKTVESTALLSVEADAEYVDALKTTVVAFSDALKQSQAIAETKTRQEADAIADDTWRGLQMQADAMTRFPEPSTKAIAIKANEIINKYGLLNTMSYDEEYANMKPLLEELQAMPEADLTKIGLKVWVDALAVAYTDYMAATVSKNTAEGNKIIGIVQQCRQEADQAYYELVFRINCGAGYNGDEPYAAFINTLNAQIAERKATLASRKTNAAKKNEIKAANAE